MATAAEKVEKRVKENLEKTKVKHKDGEKSEKKKSKEVAEKNEVGIRKGTVLDTIYQQLKKGATTKEILEALKKAHPDRDPESMSKTLKLQLFRMPKEKGFKLTRGEDGRYKAGTPGSAEKTMKSGKKIGDEPKKVKKLKAKAEKVEEEAEEEEEEEEEDD